MLATQKGRSKPVRISWSLWLKLIAPPGQRRGMIAERRTTPGAFARGCGIAGKRKTLRLRDANLKRAGGEAFLKKTSIFKPGESEKVVSLQDAALEEDQAAADA